MDSAEMKSAIEAILFAMGETVEISRLAEALSVDKKKMRSVITEMCKDYEDSSRGIRLVQYEDSVQLCTKTELYDYLIRIAKTPKKIVLTDTVMETLSIIAYKQPITRMEIERVRGVSCDHAINKLLEFDLIKELGRLDAPGRPLVFGTTEQFLRCFGVESLDALPEVSTVMLEEFKQQAEAEIQLKLDI